MRELPVATRVAAASLAVAAGILAGAAVPAQAQSPYTLTHAERDAYGGTFGINFSHYDFDRDTENPLCQKHPGYTDPACSCSIDWDKVRRSGLGFVYLKATDGIKRDLSFPHNWDRLLDEHKGERIYRGAYHFLRPGSSAKEQAATFLQAVGAVGGRRPSQIAPVLDIEWAWEKYTPGSAEDRACPAGARDDGGRHRCNMWHTKTAQQIVDLAADWIDIVEAATDRQVTIYTNQRWWDENIGRAGAELTRDQPIWISRYFKHPSGPKFDPGWEADGGSSKWRMPPLPHGAKYPTRAYTTPHFWQFAESARVAEAVYVCQGAATAKDAELNWVPAKGPDLDELFGAP